MRYFVITGCALFLAGCASDGVVVNAAPGGAGTASSAGAAGGSVGAAGNIGSGGSGASGSSGASGNPSNAGASGSAGSAGTSFDTPLASCAAPAIDRLQQWLASGEGVTLPATGSLLMPASPGYLAHIEFVSDWCTMAIWLNNAFGVETDLSKSSGFRLDYSATADFYIQLRPGGAEWSGGDQYAIAIPSSSGQRVSRTLSFDAQGWHSLFAAPKLTFEATLARASGFVAVGNTANQITFYGLRIDGFSPPCK